MKILIISDNHGHMDAFRRMTWREAPFDMLIHAGDCVGTQEDMEWIAGMPPVIVQGNCDGYYDFSHAPAERTCYIDRYRTFVTHGHRYDAHRTANRIVTKARSERCRIAVFGHTHIPGIEWIPDGQGSQWIPDDEHSPARREEFRAPEDIPIGEKAPGSAAAQPAAGGTAAPAEMTSSGGAPADATALADVLSGGLLLLNPGSIELPRQRGRRSSYIVVETSRDGALRAQIRYL